MAKQTGCLLRPNAASLHETKGDEANMRPMVDETNAEENSGVDRRMVARHERRIGEAPRLFAG